MGIIRPQDLTDQQRQDHLLAGRLYAKSHNDALPDDWFWSYLRNRRDINEARFDHWHPVVGRLLRREEESMPHPSIPCPPPSCPIPQPPLGVPCVEMPHNPPVTVVETPEPSSLLMGVLSIVAVFLAKRFR